MHGYSLGQELEMQRLLGRDLRVETPPAVAALWERARAEGIPVGPLYCLAAPWIPGAGAAIDRRDGATWIYHEPDALPRTLHFALHEIAHAARPAQGRHRTIDDYCRDERETEEEARRLTVT